MMDNSPRVEGCDVFRLRREDDVVEYLAREDDREEGGECSRLCLKSREEGSTLTWVDWGDRAP